MPTKLVFGVGTFDSIFDYVKVYGDRALIVTGKNSMYKFGALRRLKVQLIHHKVDNITYSGISPNPKVDEIRLGEDIARKFRSNIIIGLGGGSVIDAAKAIAVAVAHSEDISVFIDTGKTPGKDTLPIIAVPTTAGTGSEVTKGAIITDVKKRVKGGVRGNNIYPKVAVVDPSLTLTLPPKITAETGFDVLAHAIETYVARNANPITDIYARTAMKIVNESLENLVKGTNDLEVRYRMSLASTLMGYNVANVGTCLPHRMQYPLGALTDTSHAKGLAALLPAWMEQTWKYNIEKFSYIQNVFGECINGSSKEETASRATTTIVNFLRKINLETKLSDLGVRKDQLHELVRSVNINLWNDPGDTSDDSVSLIYERAFDSKY